MSRLREKMQGDLQLAGLCHSTQQTYLRCVAKFSSYFGKSPTQLGHAQVRAFLLDLIEQRRLSVLNVQRVCGRVVFSVSNNAGAARGGLWAQATASPTSAASAIDQ